LEEVIQRMTLAMDKIQRHAVVIDGYNTAGELIHVIDPWTGTESSIAWATFGFTWAQVPPAGAAAMKHL
jgi:hypothetical protein